MRLLASRLGMFAILALLVGCDHATKLAAKGELEGQRPRMLVQGVVDLEYAENRDVAFNALRSVPERIRAPILVALGGVAVVALAFLLLRRSTIRPPIRLGVVLVTAGALGNYLDRLARGYVVDFVHLTHWPVFNVADVYVTAGACILSWSVLRRDRLRPTS